MDELERRTIRKVSARLIPFLILCYFIAYLDRVNVGFAALTMNKDIGLTATMFGFGSGVFFLAYFFFEVPSNLFLNAFGARKWIARIMLTWGIVSGLVAFVVPIGRMTGLGNEYAFYLLRILLGFAEAGFFPGIIFYITLWFPAAYRGRFIGQFMTAVALSTVFGAPVSGAILGMHGLWGLTGWQWLFIIEAVPSLVLSVVVFYYLTDLPSQADWLADDERQWLATRLAAERAQREAVHKMSVWQAMFNVRVWALSFVYFGAVAGLYGITFWLPQIVKAFGLTNFATGVVVAIPYLVSSAAMVLWGRSSDRKLERKGHSAAALGALAIGVAAATLTSDPTLSMLAFTLGCVGVFCALPVIWTLPTAVLSGAGAAAGIAVINSVGNLAGFVGPFAMGWIKDATGSFTGGLLLIAGIGVVSMLIVLALPHDRSIEQTPGGAE